MPLACGILISPVQVNRYVFNVPPADSAPANTVPPTIAGNPVVGQTLSGTSYGTWTGYPYPSFTQQWQANSVNIAGATGTTFVLTSAQLGATIRAVVTGTNRVNSAVANSNTLGPVTDALAAPINTALPTVSGSVVVGQLLTGTNGTWTGNPAPTFTYQWYRDASTVIAGAVALTYTIVDADISHTLHLRVTGTNSQGNATASSVSTIVVPNPYTQPVNTVAPVASGASTVGSVLSTTNGTWTGNPTPTYTYQWLENETDIGGATTNTFTVLSIYEGALISCRVTATNTQGSIPHDSNAIGPITQPLTAPINTVLPSKTGVAAVGSIQTCGSGTWTGNPTPTYTYQWMRDTVNLIGGATNTTYLIVDADIGFTLRCQVTGTNSQGSANALSNQTVPIPNPYTLPVNTAAPVASGNTAVGSIVSSTTGTWTGSPAPTFTYQWRQGTADIPTKTASTYTVEAAYLGTMLSCRVTATNSQGAVPALSNQIGPVTAALSPPNPVSIPIVSGTVVVNSTLSCTDGLWTGEPTPTFTYQWQWDAGTDIAGATANDYLIAPTDVGHTLRCRVRGTNSQGTSDSFSSSTVTVPVQLTAPANTVLPSVSGITESNALLSCTQGTWTGNPTPTYAYQWLENGTDIAGATVSTYTVNVIYVGAMISCRVTASNSQGNTPVVSNAVGPITNPLVAPVNTAIPTLSGIVAVGQVLTTTDGTWTGNPTPTYSQQWYHLTGPNLNIGSTHTIDDQDIGWQLGCKVTATNSQGSAFADSLSTTVVPNPYTLPANTVAPVVSGTPRVGEVVSCTQGTWTGNPTPTYAYQWRHGTTDIAGATFNTYIVQVAYLGENLSCRVTATNTQGSTPIVSNAIGPVTPVLSAPINTVIPVLSGGTVVGDILTTNNGTWTGEPAPTFTYQWQRTGAVDIAGANSITYTLVSGDVGQTIRCRVRGTNSQGSSDAFTAYTVAITNPLSAPVNQALPAVSGTVAVGQTITCSNGTWSGNPTPTYAYQWYYGPNPVAGGTANTLLITDTYIGWDLACAVTATNSQGAASANSPVTILVPNPYTPPANTVAPAVSGAVTIGSLLSCTQGTWTGVPTPTYAYQWVQGSTDIAGQTATTYTIEAAYVGALISCRVTATNSQSSVPVSSNQVGPVTGTTARRLIGSEANGLAIGLDDNSIVIRDTVTPANNYEGTAFAKLTFTRAGTNASGINSSGYINTYSANVPRRIYDSISLAPIGLLMEEARTNSYQYSAGFDAVEWVKTTGTVAVDPAETDPEGGTASYYLTPANGSVGSVHQNISATSNTWYTVSVFCRAGPGITSIRLLAQSGMFTQAVAQNWLYDLVAGTASMTTGASAQSIGTITAYRGGWYRCVLSFRPTITTSTNGIRIRSDVAGNGSNYFNIWGAQFETGEEQSSYVATTAATATHSLELCTLATSLFNWNNAAWTVYNKAAVRQATVGVTMASMGVGTGGSTDRMTHNLARSGEAFTGFTITVANSARATGSIGGIPDPMTFYKVALSANVGTCDSCRDGVAGASGTPNALPTCTMVILGGNTNTGASMLNGVISEVLILPRKMTPAELATLTS